MGVEEIEGRPRPKFWYITDKERYTIEEFYKQHRHPVPLEEQGTIGICPYHLEIKPNSVSYTVIAVCDECAKKKFKKLRKINWIKNVTDYDSW